MVILCTSLDFVSGTEKVEWDKRSRFPTEAAFKKFCREAYTKQYVKSLVAKSGCSRYWGRVDECETSTSSSSSDSCSTATSISSVDTETTNTTYQSDACTSGTSSTGTNSEYKPGRRRYSRANNRQEFARELNEWRNRRQSSSNPTFEQFRHSREVPPLPELPKSDTDRSDSTTTATTDSKSSFLSISTGCSTEQPGACSPLKRRRRAPRPKRRRRKSKKCIPEDLPTIKEGEQLKERSWKCKICEQTNYTLFDASYPRCWSCRVAKNHPKLYYETLLRRFFSQNPTPVWKCQNCNMNVRENEFLCQTCGNPWASAHRSVNGEPNSEE